MKKFNKYGAEHQQKAQLFNKLVGPIPPTPAELLLIEQQMTRKEAASIMKKYEVNGMIFTKGTFPKEEYFIAKRIWNQIVNQDS